MTSSSLRGGEMASCALGEPYYVVEPHIFTHTLHNYVMVGWFEGQGKRYFGSEER